MPDNAPSRVDDGSGASRFKELHARTYEMELLVSGAVVFALLQLPSVVGAAFERYQEGLAGDLRLIAGMAEGYVMLVLAVLIGAFLMHLALRAYWIGLVGLESVYEGGIRWERLKMGPLTRRNLQDRIGSLARVVDRVDDLCSLLFSFGFVVVLIFLYSLAVLALAVAAGFLVAELAFGGRHLAVLVWTFFMAGLALQALPPALDRRFGETLVPGGRAARALGRLVRAGYRVSPVRWAGPIILTLSSNLTENRVAAVIVAVCLIFGAGQVGGALAGRGLFHVDSRKYFPTDLRRDGIDPRHYRDRRDTDGAGPPMPSVQSLLIRDPYLELVVPYLPRRHNELIQEECPDLASFRRTGMSFIGVETTDRTHTDAAAACVGALFEVRLDGRTLADPRWDFTLEPGSERSALVTVLPVGELAPGRHELELSVPGRRATSADRRPERHLIPFWR